jgi:hypothetical protein
MRRVPLEDAQMEKVDRLDSDESDLGLSDPEIRWVARRQLVGSLIVALMIAAVASLMAVRPARLETVNSPPSRVAGVQQPSFVTPLGQRVAGVVQHGIELP